MIVDIRSLEGHKNLIGWIMEDACLLLLNICTLGVRMYVRVYICDVLTDIYWCIISTTDFWNKNKLQFLSLFLPKTLVSPIWSIKWKFCLQKVRVAVVFWLIKEASKLDFRHFLGKKWKKLQFKFGLKIDN